MKRRLLSWLLVLAMVLTVLPAAAFAGTYKDSGGHWASTVIDRWSSYGVIKGYSDGSFAPNDQITRAEMATAVSNVLKLREKAENTFSDVKAGSWYETPVLRCAQAGLMKGYAGKMDPGAEITRAELVALLDKIIDQYITEAGSYTAKDDEIVVVAGQGIKVTEAAGFKGKIIETDLSKANASTIANAKSGTYVGKLDENGMLVYRGIQFADFEPYQAPTAVSNQGLVYADEAGPASTKGEKGCLNISIFLNPNYSGKRHVYMYQYGSAQNGGSNATMNYSNFVKENPDIIVVTPNHRGGFFGSIDLSSLAGYDAAAAKKYAGSNNLARLDLLECLKWINANIEAFGGDKNDVTIGGHSSGSNNVTCLLMMEEAQPYYHKAICQASFAGEYDQQYVDRQGNPLTSSAALEFSISQNWGKLSERGHNPNYKETIAEFYSHNEEYGRDDWTAAKDLKNDLYLRCGAIMFAEALSRYTDTYFYHLDWDITPENNLRASHGSENEVIARNWSKVPENMLDDADKISDIWATFIRSGNPNNPGMPCTWTKYNGSTHDTLYIAPQFKDSKVVEGQRQKDVDVLLPLLREYPLLEAAKKGELVTKVSKPGAYSGYSYKKFDGYKRYSVYVPVRDGTKIAVDYYIPTLNGTETTEKCPVVFTWTPYNRTSYSMDGKTLRENADAAFFTKYGYVVAIADCRGMGASYGYRDAANSANEQQDGADIVAWINEQPWCNTKIGTIGASYVGQTQLSILAKSKLVDASVIGCTDYNKYDGWIRGGVPRAFGSQPDTLWVEIGGTVSVDSVVARTVPVDADPDKTMLKEAVSQHVKNGLQIPMFQRLHYRDSFAEETGGEYWNQVSASSNAEAINNSGSNVYLLGGLYDVFRRDAFISFANMTGAKKMTIGPWYHVKPKIEIDWQIEQLRWFDYHLKGIDNGIMDEDPIYLKTANLDNESNGYRWFKDWAGYDASKATELYLTSDKTIIEEKPSVQKSLDYKAVYGIRTSVEDEDAVDVNSKGLTFAYSVDKDTEISGHPMAHISFALTDAGYQKENYDTDIFVTMSDYNPATGKSYIFSDGHIRASLRKTAEAPYNFLGLPWQPCNEEDVSYLELGKVYEVDIDLMPTSYVVKAGHKIILTISNSMDRFYYLGRSEYEADSNVATPVIQIYTGGEHASSIELPNILK